MKAVARIGDTAIGHKDILGNNVTGTITTGSDKTFSGGVGVARNGDNVHFPSHPHSAGPSNYQTHDIPITGSAIKGYSNNKKLALDGDIVPVADVAGPNAIIVATTTKFFSS